VNYITSPPLLISADWLLPAEAPPIAAGALLIENGLIKAVLNKTEKQDFLGSYPKVQHLEAKQSLLTPGLVNLHSHIDYSAAEPLYQSAPHDMFDWLYTLVRESRTWSEAKFKESAHYGAARLALEGTTFVADSSYTGYAAEALAKVGLKALVGLELFGANEAAADKIFTFWLSKLENLETSANIHLKEALQSKRVRFTTAPHAPYTVSPRLFKLALDWSQAQGLPCLSHLAESEAESAWLGAGCQIIDDYLRFVMPENPNTSKEEILKAIHWKGSGRSPVEHMKHFGLLGEHLLAAHCIKTSESDLALLSRENVALALCPRSNERLGNGLPHWHKMDKHSLRFGLGTDSLASSPDLGLRGEVRRLAKINVELAQIQRELAPELDFDLSKGLDLITIKAARALKMEREFGSLRAGKCADLAIFKIDEAECTDPFQSLFKPSSKLDMLFVNGKPVVRKGELIEDGEPELD
jgi:cytosine/adenosine deaminase-related metal-dependent hydrolase